MDKDTITETEHYGECPQCHDYTNTEIWDTENDHTIFCCCDCKITFDVLDTSPDYTFNIRADYADWYYVENILTFDNDWSGRAPHGCCQS